MWKWALHLNYWNCQESDTFLWNSEQLLELLENFLKSQIISKVKQTLSENKHESWKILKRRLLLIKNNPKRMKKEFE